MKVSNEEWALPNEAGSQSSPFTVVAKIAVAKKNQHQEVFVVWGKDNLESRYKKRTTDRIVYQCSFPPASFNGKSGLIYLME